MDSENYKKDSISLIGAISLGTGVMIGAGIFAILGQVAELSGSLLPFAFVFGAVVTGFSSYAYIKLSNNYPSAGGILDRIPFSFFPVKLMMFGFQF